MEYIAKRCHKTGQLQTLQGHSLDSLAVFYRWTEENQQFLKYFCSHWNVSYDSFCTSLAYATYLHDFGKTISVFQNNIRNNRGTTRHPHAFFSFLPILHCFTTSTLEPVIPDFPELEGLVVLSHHSQLSANLYSAVRVSSKPPINIFKRMLREVEGIASHYRSLPFSLKQPPIESLISYDTQLDEISNLSETKYVGITRLTIEDCRRKNLDYLKQNPMEYLRLKSIFSLMTAALRLSDNLASGFFEKQAPNHAEPILGGLISSGYPILPQKPVLSQQAIYGEHYATRYPYQERLPSLNEMSCILHAPCGRGKTKASLDWAVQQCRNRGLSRIIYAMPTQVTCNAMYELFKEIYSSLNEDMVSVYHGRSLPILKKELRTKEEHQEKYDTENDFDDKTFRTELSLANFRASTMSTPVVVTTIDHLILSFVHGYSNSDFALGNLMNSVVVFDEAHYYEPLTMRRLIETYGILSRMGIPFMLMSGTIPEKVDSTVRSKVSPSLVSLSTDDDGLQLEPFILVYHSDRAIVKRNKESKEWIVNEEIAGQVIKNHKAGVRQAIILNTVERAKAFYRHLRISGEFDTDTADSSLILLHSRFTWRDRREKEAKIQSKKDTRPWTVVATQVIEISLNFSTEVMFTEVAPMDALAQRAGRLNRGGESPNLSNLHLENAVLHVYEPDNELPYGPEYLEPTRSFLKDLDGRPVCYGMLRKLCSDLYEDLELHDNVVEQYVRENTLFGRLPGVDEDEETEKLEIREPNLYLFDVIPSCIYQDEGQAGLVVDNLARIPIWLIKKDQERPEGGVFFNAAYVPGKSRPWWICSLPYSSEIGFDIESFETAKGEWDSFVFD